MTQHSLPNTHVSLNKNRLKHYERVDVGHNSFDNAVFLSDGDQFEIELDNPTEETYFARIELNGSKVSNSGIVLRPGEHIFLERYLDEKKRFRFETYEVPDRNSDAIEDNGLVKVKFYKEKTSPSYGQPVIKTDSPFDWHDQPTIYESDTGSPKWTFTGDTSNIQANTSAETRSFYSNTLNVSDDDNDGIETGRVEKGEHSSQNFTRVNKNFNSFTKTTDTIKILPKSAKPATKQDIRVYCPNCGKKLKENWNFCTQCGTERP